MAKIIEKLKPIFAPVSILIGTILIIIAIVSCSKRSDSAPVVPTRLTVTDLDCVGYMRGNHIIPTMGFATADMNYAIPDEDWVKNDFLDLLRNFQFSMKQTHYAADSNDCDDFAKMAAAFARLIYGNTTKKKGTSIAIGEFYYKITGGGNHAINFALVRTKEGLVKLIFLDPQTWAEVKLSAIEAESCANWIL